MNRFRRLSSREKLLVIVTAIAIVVFVGYETIVLPLIHKREEYNLELITYEKRLESLKEIGARYLERWAEYTELQSKLNNKKGETVLTYLENTAQETGIRDEIDYIRPGQVQKKEELRVEDVEIKIDAVGIQDLVGFLERVENGRPGVLVSSLRFKPYFKDRSKTDAIVTLSDVSLER